MQEPPSFRDRPASHFPRKILVGTIIGAFPFANCYMVAFGEGEGRFVRPCLHVGGMGNFGFGAREISNLVHGTQVVVVSTENPFDYIIAAVPLITTNPGATPAEFAAQGCGTHFFTEEILRFPALEQDGVLNAASGGLLDAQVGEWGQVNELGIGFFLGRFEAFMRVDEMCGIWVNYLNKTLRLGARDYLIQTYASDDYDGFADGELNATRRRALYPSESLGVAASDQYERQLPIAEIEATGRNLQSDRDGTRAAYEPVNPDRVLLPRLLELEGRNADVLQRFVVTPSAGKSEFLQEDDERYLGLLRERYGLDGSYQLYSKNAISIRKVVTVPAPIDVQDLRHPAKDIEDQAIAEFNWNDELAETLGGGAFAVQALEHHAYIANLAGFRNLIGRSDWSVPEADAAFLEVDVPPLPTSRTKLWQPAPDPTSIPLVGEREQQMYLANSGIDILPDGTVAIDGPAGERILLGGGNIVMTCPGSIYRLPGQHDVAWAPGDIIQRAKQDVDISATDGDVRIKAEANLQAVAGNGGAGGVLIENKGSNPVAEPGVGTDLVLAGIVLRSATDVNVDGQGLTLRARESGMRVQVEQEALLSLDAGTIWMDMDDAFSFRTGEVVHTISQGITVLSTQNLAVEGNVSIPGTLGVGNRLTVEDGGVDVAGTSLFRQTVIVDGDAVASGTVAGASVGPAEDIDEQIDRIVNQVDRANAAGTIISQLTAAQADLDGVTDEVAASLEEFWLNYVEVIPRLGFSFRRDDDYTDGHDDFILPESSWQARLRAAGVSDAWEEHPVPGPDVDGSQPTLPHPGFETWQQTGQVALQPEGGLWDSVAQLPTARDSQQAGVRLGPLSGYIINAVGRTG